MKNQRPLLAALAATAALGTTGHAALFSDNFDVDTSAAWIVNAARPGPDRAIFNFDYSTIGIPSAPNSVGGTTFGLKMQANRSGSILSGISVSPLGGNFTGDYVLRFDSWLNYNGPVNGGGSGSTQAGGAGIGTAGTTPQWAGAVYDSVFFAATGDGGSSVDYRVYPKANTAAASSGMYAAGTGTSPDARNNTHPYYAGFGGETAPQDQIDLFPGQTGQSFVGSQGFAWRDVVITKEGNTVTYDIDGLRIATVDISNITLGGNNILLTYFDTATSSSTDLNADALLFGLFDNVRVTPVPEPATYAMAFGTLALGFGFFRRRLSKKS